MAASCSAASALHWTGLSGPAQLLCRQRPTRPLLVKAFAILVVSRFACPATPAMCRATVVTPYFEQAVFACVAECCEAALREAGVSWTGIAGIGFGCPGAVDGGVIKAASNFPTWKDVKVAEIMRRISGGVRIVVGNDANAAMLAELWVGAGKARSHPPAGLFAVTTTLAAARRRS